MFITQLNFERIIEWFQHSEFEYLVMFLPNSDTRNNEIEDYIVLNQMKINALSGGLVAFIAYDSTIERDRGIFSISTRQMYREQIHSNILASEEACRFFHIRQYELPALIIITKRDLSFKLYSVSSIKDVERLFAPLSVVSSFLNDRRDNDYEIRQTQKNLSDIKNKETELQDIKEKLESINSAIIEYGQDELFLDRIRSRYLSLLTYLKRAFQQKKIENAFKYPIDYDELLNKFSKKTKFGDEYSQELFLLCEDLKKIPYFDGFYNSSGRPSLEFKDLFRKSFEYKLKCESTIKRMEDELSLLVKKKPEIDSNIERLKKESDEILSLYSQKLRQVSSIRDCMEFIKNIQDNPMFLIELFDSAYNSDDSQEHSNNETFHIFISYSRKDIEKVFPLINELENHGVKVWFDLSRIDYGETFPDKIANALDASDSLLFLCTPNSLIAPYCKKEVGYARNNKKKIRAILVDGEMPRKGWFALEYQDVNCINITKPEQKRKFIEEIELVYQLKKAEERRILVEEANARSKAQEEKECETGENIRKSSTQSFFHKLKDMLSKCIK